MLLTSQHIPVAGHHRQQHSAACDPSRVINTEKLMLSTGIKVVATDYGCTTPRKHTHILQAPRSSSWSPYSRWFSLISSATVALRSNITQPLSSGSTSCRHSS